MAVEDSRSNLHRLMGHFVGVGTEHDWEFVSRIGLSTHRIKVKVSRELSIAEDAGTGLRDPERAGGVISFLDRVSEKLGAKYGKSPCHNDA